MTVIIQVGESQKRYRVPNSLVRDLENWLRWAEKHGGVEVEGQPSLFPLQEKVSV